MGKLYKNWFNIYGLGFLAVLSALSSYFIHLNNNLTTSELAKNAQYNLHLKETKAKQYLNEFAQKLKNTSRKNAFKNYQNDDDNLFKQHGIAIYGYKNDSLCFWTTNKPAVDLYAYTNETDVQLVKIRNGWYEFIKHKDTIGSNYTFIALILIKSEYDFENKYLDNSFSKWLELPENTKLIVPINYFNHAITSQFGPPLFEIYRTDGLYQNTNKKTLSLILSIIAIILANLLLYLIIKKTIKNTIAQLGTFIMICFFARTLMIYYKLPTTLYNNDLYNSSIFANAASFYFSYLGDILINSFLIFVIAILSYKLPFNGFKFKWAKTILGLFTFIAIYLGALLIYNLIESLINNSTISYNINQLFNFNWLSVIGILSVVLLMLSCYLLIERTVNYFSKHIKFNRLNNTLINVAILIFISLYIYLKLYVNPFVWVLPIFLITYLLIKYKATYNFINIGVIILTSTLCISTLFYHHEKINKQKNYEALSENLLDRQDIVAENEFIKISESIKNDYKLKNLLSFLPLSKQQIEQRLRQINFSGYFERYDVVLSLFKNDSSSVFNTSNPIYSYESYFKRQIEEEGLQTICDDLFFINQEKKPIRYIAEIQIEDINKNPSKSFRLYVQLEPKITGNLGAFPDLLLDKSTQIKIESKEISYALYESGKLINAFGEFQYPLFAKTDFFKSDNSNKYSHYVFNNKKNISIIISDKKNGAWERFTSNSYLFIFFSLIVLIIISFKKIFVDRTPILKSLNKRIQFIFVIVIITSLASVVSGTIWVVKKQFEEKNSKDLIVKSNSILMELSQTIGQQDYLDYSYKDFTTYSLKKLSQLFSSDITLYNSKGVLYSASQPAIYEQGLISKFMNPIAFSSFSEQTKANFIHTESIGALNYLSAYIPFYSKNDELLGYINLPYFSRQKDLEKELSAYLTTLINIYTILFVITVLSALLVSNLLTKPLRIIKQQISSIKFGGQNEALFWKAGDEIGDLVDEYNNMLIKLEKNSKLLAQSERESAWREMAKQVAHEIKNPLTPMKLNVQHLQRIANTNPDDISGKIDRVSKTLIDQIDTLTHIANEFSNFAKMPKANLEIVNVFEVMQNVTDLFKSNSNCDITMDVPNPLVIYADKDQCIRIFTNLIKNAEQAIPDNRNGKIEIVASNTNQFVTIKITDNGCGIPDELKSKLFTPNFTTKSTGTGLGLAMVKNSILSFNGSISFDTKLNEGTTFTINFPSPKSSDLQF